MDRRTFLTIALAAPAFAQTRSRRRQAAALAARPPSRSASQPRAVPWTQWGGPHRNFQTEATGLKDTWPAERSAGDLEAASRRGLLVDRPSRTACCTRCTASRARRSCSRRTPTPARPCGNRSTPMGFASDAAPRWATARTRRRSSSATGCSPPASAAACSVSTRRPASSCGLSSSGRTIRDRVSCTAMPPARLPFERR